MQARVIAAILFVSIVQLAVRTHSQEVCPLMDVFNKVESFNFNDHNTNSSSDRCYFYLINLNNSSGSANTTISFKNTLCDCNECLISLYSAYENTSQSYMRSICNASRVVVNTSASILIIQFRLKAEGAVSTIVSCNNQSTNSLFYQNQYAPTIIALSPTTPTIRTSTSTTTKSSSTTPASTVTTSMTTNLAITNSTTRPPLATNTTLSTTRASTTSTQTPNPNSSADKMKTNLYKTNQDVKPVVGGLSRIIGGQTAQANSWPWQAWLNLGRGFCGGSVIRNQWILTSAHCTYSVFNPSGVKVYLGYQNRRNLSANFSSSAKIINHELYDPITLQNDIALIKLAKPLNYSIAVQPICLPSTNLAKLADMGVVTGWGSIDLNGDYSNDFPSLLQQVEVPIRPSSFCNGKSRLSPSQFCAGVAASTVVNVKDSCFGDSGGPFQVKYRSVYQQVGLVSYGISNDCDGNGIYTNVWRYVSWIEEQIAANS